MVRHIRSISAMLHGADLTRIPAHTWEAWQIVQHESQRAADYWQRRIREHRSAHG